MQLFRVYLISLWLACGAYTAITIRDHGLDLFDVFFGDMQKMAWPGQFNTDFLCLLTLSALWTAWRNNFSITGLVLSALALFGGTMFLFIYLLTLSLNASSVAEVIIGKQRMSGAPAERKKN